ncbi:MAG TPA: riboflavin synthase [Tepidisphaeraceae bacterium]|jgi:riboflavin synthase
MFTGIVSRTLEVAAAVDHAGGRALALPIDPLSDAQHGESIAINGVCLTLARTDGRLAYFDVIRETLDKTNLGALKAGDCVNVERSLRVGDRIDGHFVQGHVDGVGRLVHRIATDEEWRFTIEAPPPLVKYLVPKGSICIDGVSLTIAAISGSRFDVTLIPTTLQLTTLGSRQIGWALNLECDTLSKQIVTFLELRAGDVMEAAARR